MLADNKYRKSQHIKNWRKYFFECAVSRKHTELDWKAKEKPLPDLAEG
jgi:hypothetical protein